jgi:hypothetical protein
LSFEGDVGGEQFVRKAFFISRFEESGTKRLMNLDCGTDDLLCYFIHWSSLCVLSVSAVNLRICFHQCSLIILEIQYALKLYSFDFLQRLAGDALKIAIHADGCLHDAVDLFFALGPLAGNGFLFAIEIFSHR